jgi:hypothetical protein
MASTEVLGAVLMTPYIAVMCSTARYSINSSRLRLSSSAIRQQASRALSGGAKHARRSCECIVAAHSKRIQISMKHSHTALLARSISTVHAQRAVQPQQVHAAAQHALLYSSKSVIGVMQHPLLYNIACPGCKLSQAMLANIHKRNSTAVVIVLVVTLTSASLCAKALKGSSSLSYRSA